MDGTTMDGQAKGKHTQRSSGMIIDNHIVGGAVVDDPLLPLQIINSGTYPV
jgi:hypothetical protein